MTDTERETTEALQYSPSLEDLIKVLHDEANNDDAESVDVLADCWGGLEFSIVNDLPDIISGKTFEKGEWLSEQVMRFLFGLIFYFINIFIQVSLLAFITKMLMMPSFKSAQDLYKHFHEESFDEGGFSPSRFHDFPHHEKADLCGVALAHALVTKILIFLWVSSNMAEFVSSLSRFTVIWTHRRLPAGCSTTEMVLDHKDPDKVDKFEFWVICLNLTSKFLLQGMVYIPKMIIAVVLGATGSLWLLAAQDFGDLILNSLALGFVTQVDEYLSIIFFPSCFREDCLVPFQYRFYNRQIEAASHKAEKQYMRGILKLVVTASMVELLYRYQFVIPNYKADINVACLDHFQRQWPWCYPFQEDCFPTNGS